MMEEHVQSLVENCGLAAHSVRVVPEGGAEPLALLGSVRFARWLAGQEPFCHARAVELVLDCGTGATAAGLALGIALLGLERTWKVTGIEVGSASGTASLTAADLLHRAVTDFDIDPEIALRAQHVVSWVPRIRPRKFGRLLPGDAAAVRAVAVETGIVLDPLWTLAAWEGAVAAHAKSSDQLTVMLHTGGTMGLSAVAERWPGDFAEF